MFSYGKSDPSELAEASDMIYVHDGVSGELLTSSQSSPTYLRGVAFDGTNLVNCDSVSNVIYLHDSPQAEFSAIKYSPQEV